MKMTNRTIWIIEAGIILLAAGMICFVDPPTKKAQPLAAPAPVQQPAAEVIVPLPSGGIQAAMYSEDVAVQRMYNPTNVHPCVPPGADGTCGWYQRKE